MHSLREVSPLKNLEQIIHDMALEVLVSGEMSDRFVSHGYACDMLSWVMAHATPTDLWMTILNSVNVIAVAVLTDCAAVLLTEGVELPEDVAARARDKQIIVLRTPLSTYEASVRLAACL